MQPKRRARSTLSVRAGPTRATPRWTLTPGRGLSTAGQVVNLLEKIILPRIRLVFECPDPIHEIRELDSPRGRHREVHQWIIQDGHDVRDRFLAVRHLDVCPGDAALVAIDSGDRLLDRCKECLVGL